MDTPRSRRRHRGARHDGLLADGVAGAYTKMQNWKTTTAKACWNDVDAQYDPAPVKYIVNNNDASLALQHGSCTDWL
ncbi:hypothetical protein AB0D91_37480 [Streptomyces canus]|uniref:hypothetical protein n=1 Tax=Streptomyces canus TaxID=58343 RepID=UPI0033FC6700